MRGFTLVELAIVIVIAGILAAVAIPIYQGIVNESKWTEGKTGAGTIRQALDVYKAKLSGSLDSNVNGTAADTLVLSTLKLTNGFDNARYFSGTSYVISSTTAGLYTITVSSGFVADGPTGGPFIMDQAGNESGP